MNSKEIAVRYRYYRIPRFLVEVYKLSRGSSLKGPPLNGTVAQWSRKGFWIGGGVRLGTPWEKGGVVVCEFVNEDGEVVAVGRAVCSLSENFVYDVGKRIAYQRAQHDHIKNASLFKKLSDMFA